jgi:hypothetical protein
MLFASETDKEEVTVAARRKPLACKDSWARKLMVIYQQRNKYNSLVITICR